MRKLIRHKNYGKSIGRNFWLFGLGIYLGCAITLNVACSVSAFAASEDNKGSQSLSNTDTQLDKLEKKLFQHNYAKDSTDARLERLEKIIFGESQKGSNDARLAALVKAVPNLDNSAAAVGTASSETPVADTSGNAKNEANQAKRHKSGKSKDIASENDTDNSAGVGNYPAVTAMETKLFGKDYASEPVQNRLARLEKKKFGAVSTSDDLSERVDKLKEATGIDIASKQRSLNDWLEDDDDTGARSSRRGADDLSYVSPDIYKDMQKSFGMPTNRMRDPYSSAYIPDITTGGPGISINSFGISQKVIALEHELFGKSYEHDPLPARLNRLEASVFPGQKPAVDTPLPQRVQNLLAKVPIRQQELQQLAQTYGVDTDNANTAQDDSNNTSNANQKSRSSLSKIIGSLGNMLSGGMAGSSSVNGGNYMLDPRTGMLVDPNTGNMINPNTGTAYSAGSVSPYGSGRYGYNNNYLNNGMAPFGMPYGMGSGMGSGFGSGFGFGGGGTGFGFGFR